LNFESVSLIYDMHLCITIQSNSQNIIQCSISNSLWYKEGNLCLTFLANDNDNENAWHLTEFILPQYISTHVILQTNMAGSQTITNATLYYILRVWLNCNTQMYIVNSCNLNDSWELAFYPQVENICMTAHAWKFRP
jgi:hypothetical protein